MASVDDMPHFVEMEHLLVLVRGDEQLSGARKRDVDRTRDGLAVGGMFGNQSEGSVPDACVTTQFLY